MAFLLFTHVTPTLPHSFNKYLSICRAPGTMLGPSYQQVTFSAHTEGKSGTVCQTPFPSKSAGELQQMENVHRTRRNVLWAHPG